MERVQINGGKEPYEKKIKEKTRVLLLSLSVFSAREGVASFGEPNQYAYETNSGERTIQVEGHYQLEPVPKIMEQMGAAPDIIIMLCQAEGGETPKVKIRKKIVLTKEGKSEEASELEFFKERIEEYYNEKNRKVPIFQDIDIDLDKPEIGIQEVVNYIREIPKDQVELYLDTHGGLRGIQRVLEAVVSLLRLEDYDIMEIFGLEFIRDGVSPVFSEKRRFMMFDFVAGMNEFNNSGKINSLKRFLGNEEDELVQAIGEVAEGIQWSDVYSFTNGIERLNQFFQDEGEVKNDYLKMFKEKIRDDYGPLIGPHYTSDEVKWCMEKQFYQQALTLIEARISLELLEKGIICPTGGFVMTVNNRGIERFETSGVKDDGSPATIIIEKNELWNSFVHHYQNLNQCKVLSQQYRFRGGPNSIPGNPQNIGQPFTFNRTNDFDKLIERHKELKKIRNNANHLKPFTVSKREIVQMIEEYLELLAKL